LVSVGWPEGKAKKTSGSTCPQDSQGRGPKAAALGPLYGGIEVKLDGR
jgi:hypothetical protein